MKTVWFVVCVTGFVVANTWSSVLFKMAADQSGKRAIWIYVAGNVIGAFGPLAITFALKSHHPNVTYALCYGGAFALLQLVSWRLFQQPLTPFQWLGVAAVGAGIFLLQIGQR